MVPSPTSMISSSKRYDVSEKNDSSTKNINEPSCEARVVTEKMFKRIALGLLVLLLATSLLFQWRICTFLIDGIIRKGDTQPSALQLSAKPAPSTGIKESGSLENALKKEVPRQVSVTYNFYTINSNNKYKMGLKASRKVVSRPLKRTKKSYRTTLQDVDAPTSAIEIGERTQKAMNKTNKVKFRLFVVPLSSGYLAPRKNTYYASSRYLIRPNYTYSPALRPTYRYYLPRSYSSYYRPVYRSPRSAQIDNQTLIQRRLSYYPNYKPDFFPVQNKRTTYITPYQFWNRYQQRYTGYY